MNKTTKLDFSAFEKAIRQLEKSLVYYHSKIVQQDPELVLQLRAAAIQAFECTYEFACKMIKRYLDLAQLSPPAIREISFPDLIRTANEHDLLRSDLAVWKEYRQQRGTTSHTYDPEKAQRIFEKIPSFLAEVKDLLVRLKEHSKTL